MSNRQQQADISWLNEISDFLDTHKVKHTIKGFRIYVEGPGEETLMDLIAYSGIPCFAYPHQGQMVFSPR